MTLLKSVLDRIAAEKKLNFVVRIGRNSGSLEYHYGSQHSQLFDVP
jgi:hypothetical protein